MTPTEAVNLCRLARALCPGQHFDEFSPDAWHLVLEDLRFKDCQEALKLLGREQTFIAPNEIWAKVKAIRSDRLLRYGPLNPPPEVDSGERDYNEWLRTTQKAIADGDLEPPTQRPADKAVRAKVDRAIEGTFRSVASEIRGTVVSSRTEHARQIADARPEPRPMPETPAEIEEPA